MRRYLLITLCLGTTLLAACGKEKCTREVLDQKATDLMIKVQSVGKENPMKIIQLGGKIADVVDKANIAEADDLGPFCEAIDTLSAELDKD